MPRSGLAIPERAAAWGSRCGVFAATLEVGVWGAGEAGVSVFDGIWPFVPDSGLGEVAALMAGDPPAVEDVDGR